MYKSNVNGIILSDNEYEELINREIKESWDLGHRENFESFEDFKEWSMGNDIDNEFDYFEVENCWKFENGIEVHEVSFDFDLHQFKVYEGERYLGNITPASIEDMKACINALNSGEDPISASWEDGMGNLCLLDGWYND